MISTMRFPTRTPSTEPTQHRPELQAISWGFPVSKSFRALAGEFVRPPRPEAWRPVSASPQPLANFGMNTFVSTHIWTFENRKVPSSYRYILLYPSRWRSLDRLEYKNGLLVEPICITLRHTRHVSVCIKFEPLTPFTLNFGLSKLSRTGNWGNTKPVHLRAHLEEVLIVLELEQSAATAQTESYHPLSSQYTSRFSVRCRGRGWFATF